MPASKKNKASADEKTQAMEKKYPASRLLKSRALSGYQPDFARVVLTKPEYTIREAKETLDAVLKGGK